jgi:hypothetical protein
MRPVCIACALATLAACVPNAAPGDGPSRPPASALTTFGSDEAFTRYQERMERDWQARMRNRPIYGSYPATPKPPTPPPVPAGEPVEAQAPGMHEAGIVKATRDYLVILRRDRLHTVRIADGALDTVASVDAFAPGADEYERSARGILVSGDVVAVIGAGRGPSVQAALFRVDAAGRLAYLGTHQVRSDGGDERTPIVMIDGKLVVFAPVGVWAGDPRGIAPSLPAVRRWEPGSADTVWTPLLLPGAVYRPATAMRADDGTTFHALTVCDPSGGTLDCRATVVYAPRNIAHHVSRTAAYAWTTQRRGYDEEGDIPDRSVLYRIPLDGRAPTAVAVDGVPEDTHAFDETADGELHVLLSGGRLPVDRAPAGWNSVVLLRVPLAAFGDGSRKMEDGAYGGGFPNPGSTTFRSRFVGGWIVYGTEAGEGAYGTQEQSRVFAVRRDGAGGAVPVPVQGGLIGIDPMAADVLVTTGAGEITHQPLRLGTTVAPGTPFTRANPRMWEAEGHAVFYAPSEGDAGVLGVARSGFLFEPSVLFLRHDASGLREMGAVGSTVPPGTECPGCGGYYEFARPVFLRGRTLAIVGGEVVEGTMEGGRIRELRRVRIGPPAFSAP